MDHEHLEKVLVVGAGVMGHGIAQVFGQAGLEVNLVDIDAGRLNKAMDLIQINLQTLAEFGRMPSSEIPAVLKRIHTSTDLADSCYGVGFAIEVVSEIPATKKQVLSLMEKLCPAGTVIASNTSSLDIFALSDLKKPEYLVAAHWFEPAHIIPLVEVCPGPATAPEVVEFTAGLMERIGKKPMVMDRFVPAFIVNRIQIAVSQAVWELLDNKLASPEQIDLAVKTSLGIRLPVVGVVQRMDFTGLDLISDIGKAMGVERPLIQELVKQGHLGVKTSKGILDYGGRTEAEIKKERDRRYLKVLETLEAVDAFKPV